MSNQPEHRLLSGLLSPAAGDVDHPHWSLEDLQTHLQYAVNLEFWTIPYYMSAMYSIKDRSSNAFQLIQSVVNQEMFHMQLAANILNAFGKVPGICLAPYYGKKLPHLRPFPTDHIPTKTAQEKYGWGAEDWSDDRLEHIESILHIRDGVPPPTKFRDYSAEIGPLDTQRINAMCLIEYPSWETKEKYPFAFKGDLSEYRTIGEFYQAVALGSAEHFNAINRDPQGIRNQVSIFERFYEGFENQTVTGTQIVGLMQVFQLIDAITEQGEGISSTLENISPNYQNTADDPEQELTHFEKFYSIYQSIEGGEIVWPETYAAHHKPRTEAGRQAQDRLYNAFGEFKVTLGNLFSGNGLPENFSVQMFTLGSLILACWQNGAIPRYPTDEGC